MACCRRVSCRATTRDDRKPVNMTTLQLLQAVLAKLNKAQWIVPWHND